MASANRRRAGIAANKTRKRRAAAAKARITREAAAPLVIAANNARMDLLVAARAFAEALAKNDPGLLLTSHNQLCEAARHWHSSVLDAARGASIEEG